MALPSYTVWFRGFPACPCLAEWLPVYEAELQRRGALVGPLRIFQLIGSASASANTHKDGGAGDITDLVSELDIWVARQMGADAAWPRTRAQGFTPHIHFVLRGCPHNGPAAYQIAAVDAGFNGLGAGGRGGRDDGPRPLSGRTWREGIAWVKEQQEDDMAQYAEQLNTIEEDAAEARRLAGQALQEVRAFRRGKSKSDQKVKAFLRQIVAEVKDDATKTQAREILAEIQALEDAES